jgi:hypothetical protein
MRRKMHKSVIGKLAVAAVLAWAFGAPAFAADSKAERKGRLENHSFAYFLSGRPGERQS